MLTTDAMTAHPNRSRLATAPARYIGHAEVAAARAKAGLTIPAAARLVRMTPNGWAKWEADPATVAPGGSTRMPGGAWDLFRLRTGQITLAELDALDQRG